MLKISSTESTEPKKGVVGVDGNSKAGRDGGELDGSGMDKVEFDGGEVGDNEVGKKGQKTFKNLSKSKNTVGLDFFTSEARLAFIKLSQVFVKALILQHFDLKYHVRIETDAFSYAIGGVFSQLILDDLGQWHPLAFFL